MFLLCFTFPKSHNLIVTFSDQSPYCVLLFYKLIRDCGPGNNFPTFCRELARASCESSSLSCTTQDWAAQKVTRVLPHVLCWSVHRTFHAILVVLFTLQGDSAESLLSLISHSSAFQLCVFLDAVK